MQREMQEDEEQGSGAVGREPETPVMDSADLFRGAGEIVIRHAGREYRLRKTRLDKLILTA